MRTSTRGNASRTLEDLYGRPLEGKSLPPLGRDRACSSVSLLGGRAWPLPVNGLEQAPTPVPIRSVRNERGPRSLSAGNTADRGRSR